MPADGTSNRQGDARKDVEPRSGDGAMSSPPQSAEGAADRLDLTSLVPAITQQEVLMGIFPEAFSDGRLDFDELKRTLGVSVSTTGDRFGISWAGRAEAFANVQIPSTGTLLPDRESSVESATNIFVDGDNLEILKLLQRSYHGRVKMIYIDPPYNTGRDFIYPDNYREGLQSYLRYSGQLADDGFKLSAGPETAGRLHARWLDMLYPRLFLARNLLREDGVLFCSIDDHEVHNLRHLLNIVFGEESFVGMLVWQSKKGGGSDKGGIVQDQEYVLCYSKARDGEAVGRTLIPSEPLDREDAKGPYRQGRELNKWESNSRREDRPTMFFPISGPNGEDVYPIRNDGDEGCWRWGTARMKAVLTRGDAEFVPRGDGTFVVYEKIRSTDPRSKPYRTWLPDVGTTAQGSTEVKALFDGKKVFDYPKPLALLKHLIRIGASGQDDIVLDFFAGSCTTAQAVMEINLEDGGDRHFICAELPMPVPEDSEAHELGLMTIAAVGRERIRRAINSLTREYENGTDLDSQVAGFRAFRLSSSNFKTWDPEVTDSEQLELRLRAYAENLVEDRTADDVLFEVLLKLGAPLETTPVAFQATVPDVWLLPELATVLCLAREIDAAAIGDLLIMQVERVLCLDVAFRGRDDLKTNAVLQARDRGIRFMTA